MSSDTFRVITFSGKRYCEDDYRVELEQTITELKAKNATQAEEIKRQHELLLGCIKISEQPSEPKISP